MIPHLLPLVTALALMVGSAAAADVDYDELGRAGWGGRVIPVPLETQAERDLVPGQGGLVVRVRPGSTADRLGIQPGDIVLSINDRPIATRRDIRDLMATVKPGDDARVTVITAQGTVRQLDGDFHKRLPRPPGTPGLPWGGQPRDPARLAAWRTPEDIIAAQRARLLAEQALLAQARRDLILARARLPTTPAGWFMRVAIAVDADADANGATP